MNDREKWRERVRDIRATSATWWWWWLSVKQGSTKYHTIVPFLIRTTLTSCRTEQDLGYDFNHYFGEHWIVFSYITEICSTKIIEHGRIICSFQLSCHKKEWIKFSIRCNRRQQVFSRNERVINRMCSQLFFCNKTVTILPQIHSLYCKYVWIGNHSVIMIEDSGFNFIVHVKLGWCGVVELLSV